MNILKIITILMLIITSSPAVFPRENPKFGKISDEELQMTGISEDPEADAVYLVDKGDLEIANGGSSFYISLKRLVRIKILTEEGKSHADIKLMYWYKNKIRDIKAHAILPNGKKIELQKKDIHDEKMNEWKFKTFAIPGVEVGTVIEYKYEMRSDYIHFLEPWYFQNSEFTRLSQFSVTVPPYFSYNAFYRNIYDIEYITEEIRQPGQRLKNKKFTWQMTNLQPIREEPYMRAPDDYRISMHFQIREYKSPYTKYSFIKTWSDLVKEQREIFEKYLGNDKYLKTLVKKQLTEELSTLDKINKLYDYVRTEIETTGGYGWVLKNKTANVAKKFKGSGVEKNLLLVNMLNLAGFEAYPLAISTRYHGKIIRNQPSLSQFNYVLAYVKANGKSYVFDTRDLYCPYNMLPVDVLVEKGLLIDNAEGAFIEIPQTGRLNSKVSDIESSLNNNGDLLAVSKLRFEGYHALAAREKIRLEGEAQFVKDILKERLGEVQIDSFQIDRIDKIEEPLSIKVAFRVPEFAQIAGNMIYLNAPFINALTENPFKSEHRYFPVEFAFKTNYLDNISMTLPEGYTVEELPQKVTRLNKKYKLRFANAWKITGDSLHISRQFIRNKQIYSAREYDWLRKFYKYLVREDQRQIVLGQEVALSEIRERVAN